MASSEGLNNLETTVLLNHSFTEFLFKSDLTASSGLIGSSITIHLALLQVRTQEVPVAK